jgi:protein-disulfide isomerase
MTKQTQQRARRNRRSARTIAAQHAATRRRRRWVLGGAVGAALAIAFTLIIINQPDGGSNALPAVEAAAPGEAGIPTSHRTIGDPSAPVTVVEWGDYQCPYCGVFSRDVQPHLIQEYVSTGQVRFEYRDLAFLGEESNRAAEAAACAGDQDAFWRYHDTLFANQHGENQGAFSRERLEAMARQLNLDMGEFTQCLENKKHEDRVNAMRQEAQDLGITATPTLVVNGRVISFGGYEDLKAAIEAELP